MKNLLPLFFVALGLILAASPAKAERQPAQVAIEARFDELKKDGKIGVEIIGTGQSIGHVADLAIRNLTDGRLQVPVPAMLLESRSGRFQHYACPYAQTVTLGPRQEKSVALDGLCLVRTKPPVGRGVRGELIICDGNPNTPRDPDSDFSAKDAGKIVRVAKSYCDAADKLERQNQLDEIPYRSAKKKKEIVKQWGVWMDPEICKRTGTRRATKKDLTQTIIRQAEKKEQGPLPPKKKEEIDRGIDEIFEDIQLTTKEAKALEEPDPFAGVELTGPKVKSAT